MKKTVWITALIGLLLDQIVKLIIVDKIKINESIEVIKHLFYITNTRNTGGAWGILGNNTLLLVFIAILFLFFYIAYIIKEENMTLYKGLTYGLLLSGITGNMIDRVFHGYVIDFLHIYIFDYNFPVFNLADMFIVIPVGLLMIDLIRGERNEHNSK